VGQNLPDLDPSAGGSERLGATGRPEPPDTAGGMKNRERVDF